MSGKKEKGKRKQEKKLSKKHLEEVLAKSLKVNQQNEEIIGKLQVEINKRLALRQQLGGEAAMLKELLKEFDEADNPPAK